MMNWYFNINSNEKHLKQFACMIIDHSIIN